MSPWVVVELTSFGTAVVAALCGSIPFGLLLTRAAGLGDIRAIGSGNIGATNVLRTGKRGLALATLLLDAGKGVATGLGALLALDWRVGALSCAAWLLGAAATRMSSAGALTAFAVSPFAAAWFLPAWWWVAPASIAALVFWRHEANIRRIFAGTEPRIGGKTS